jgi:XTP/dITP diphosphohydrolase
LVVATRNAHKLRELAQILRGYDLEPLPDGVDLPPEEGEDFAANALTKARAAHRATGRPALADDSGIVVAALGGAPGVQSARFAGSQASDEENLALLLERMSGVEDRRAAYVCCIAFVTDDEEQLFEGHCAGVLATAPRGTGGFGYDPAFVPDDTGPRDARTMAELSAEEKHELSHRGRAARALGRWLAARAARES